MRTLSETEKMKYQAARELGLLEKLFQVGWAGMNTAETGRVGGRVSAMKRRARKE